MNKYIKISILLIVLLFFGNLLALAKSDEKILVNNSEYLIPEQDGVYDVAGRPDLKLRVFVHRDKTIKPGKPAPAPIQEACGLLDPDSFAEVSSAGWKLPNTWVYRLNPSSVPLTVGKNNLSIITQNAFSKWIDAVSNKVLISRGVDTTINRAVLDGQNIIAWGRASNGALAISYIWYDRTSGIATEIDTIMNNKYSWYWSNPQSWPLNDNCAYQGVYDAQNILTHELGHTMGLDDVYSGEYTNNTMYGYGSKWETKKDTLTTGDKISVGRIY